MKALNQEYLHKELNFAYKVELLLEMLLLHKDLSIGLVDHKDFRVSFKALLN